MNNQYPHQPGQYDGPDLMPSQPNEPATHHDVMGSFGVGGMDGVWDFKDLQANSGDEAIADGIRHLLREDAATTCLDIEVAVKQGCVRLTGNAQAPEAAAHAESLAGSVAGVSAVIDDMSVRSI